ncbi:Ribosome assembly protein 3 [Apiospora hydei]|uniref:Ribosome assembly protein 3 n=1 Tax=Apiospora hydei TaxID=1337664 RepID=A0ABR1X888_9PEZI
MAPKDETSEFTSFYLQQSTKELAEDLDKARTADDFKGDALPMLIKALQQGTTLFTPAEQKRIAPPLAKEGDAKKAKTSAESDDDEDEDDSDATSSSGGSSTSSSGSDDEEDDDEEAEGGDAKTSSDSSSEDSSSSDED